MKRQDFIKIIRLRSVWKIDCRKGNYALPNGEKLSDYVRGLVESKMKIDNLGVLEDGDLAYCDGGEWNKETKDFNDYRLLPDFKDNEICPYDKQEMRIKRLVSEIIS